MEKIALRQVLPTGYDDKNRQVSMSSTSPDQLLPEELFHALATVVPRLIAILEHQCQLVPMEMLVIWHLKHFGKENADGERIVARSEITKLLEQKFSFSASNVTKLLDGLQDKGLIDRKTVGAKELKNAFGSDGSERKIVVLKVEGIERIEAFKRAIQIRVMEKLNEQRAPVRTAIIKLTPIAANIAKKIIDYYEPSVIATRRSTPREIELI